MYKLSIHERPNKKWRLVIYFDGFKNHIKIVEYDDLDTAIKELKRAIEIRENPKLITKQMLGKKYETN